MYGILIIECLGIYVFFICYFYYVMCRVVWEIVVVVVFNFEFEDVVVMYGDGSGRGKLGNWCVCIIFNLFLCYFDLFLIGGVDVGNCFVRCFLLNV